jgi:hypothetical protein
LNRVFDIRLATEDVATNASNQSAVTESQCGEGVIVSIGQVPTE